MKKKRERTEGKKEDRVKAKKKDSSSVLLYVHRDNRDCW